MPYRTVSAQHIGGHGRYNVYLHKVYMYLLYMAEKHQLPTEDQRYLVRTIDMLVQKHGVTK